MRICVNGVMRDATAEESSAFETARIRAEVEEKSRPLTVSEVTTLLLKQQVATLDIDDATASRMVEYYPELTGSGNSIAAGTRINWQGQLKRAAVACWDRVDNWPDAAPTLWEDINYKDGIRVIPESITAGLAFSADELGWWGASVYRSKADANVYTPDQYAANWELVM